MKQAYGGEGGAFPRAGDSALLPFAPSCLGRGSTVRVEEENWSAGKGSAEGRRTLWAFS